MERHPLPDLAAFVRVAELRSFRRAAQALGVSPSALSHTLRNIETKLGVRLLHRTTRSVAPTEAGERLLERLRPALNDIDGALAELKGFKHKNIALEVFSKKFKEGAYHSNKLENTQNYSIVIRPEILNYDYRYNQLKNLGFAITPEAKIDLFVYLYDKQGKLVLEKKYESEYLSGGSYMVSFSPHEKVNKAIHEVIYNLLNNISHDVEATLLRLAKK